MYTTINTHLQIRKEPTQLYAQYKEMQVGFVATYNITVGMKESPAYVFFIYSEDETFYRLFKRNGFLITLKEPIETFIENNNERIAVTPDQVEFMNAMYEVIHERCFFA